MKKKIWITSLTNSQPMVQEVMASLQKYGLEVDGHFWEDDLKKMAWCKPRKELLDQAVSMWMIHGGAETLAKQDVRYGLSMLVLTLQAARGGDFPIVFLQEGEAVIEPESLPTPLAGRTVYPVSAGTYGPKVVARLHKTYGLTTPPYRLDVYGIPHVGQWFEVGPRETEWNGVIFGTAGEGISMHAVGFAGRLPERCTLNYPQQGLKIQLGEREFDGWAVQNRLDNQSSYFVKVDTYPATVMFCPYTQEEETEAFIIELA